ncbi:MAG: hypothetical protein U0231_12390 [Nitrospiraceae bacterium]
MTTRQQIQVRHLAIGEVSTVFDLLQRVGLTSMQTGMDSVRNVMTCPVAGLNPNELLTVPKSYGPSIKKCTRQQGLYESPRGVRNVAVTGCLDNCLHMETQDIALGAGLSRPRL